MIAWAVFVFGCLLFLGAVALWARGDPRCPARLEGFRCEKFRGHAGLHAHTETRWTDAERDRP